MQSIRAPPIVETAQAVNATARRPAFDTCKGHNNCYTPERSNSVTCKSLVSHHLCLGSENKARLVKARGHFSTRTACRQFHPDHVRSSARHEHRIWGKTKRPSLNVSLKTGWMLRAMLIILLFLSQRKKSSGVPTNCKCTQVQDLHTGHDKG